MGEKINARFLYNAFNGEQIFHINCAHITFVKPLTAYDIVWFGSNPYVKGFLFGKKIFVSLYRLLNVEVLLRFQFTHLGLYMSKI